MEFGIEQFRRSSWNRCSDLCHVGKEVAYKLEQYTPALWLGLKYIEIWLNDAYDGFKHIFQH